MSDGANPKKKEDEVKRTPPPADAAVEEEELSDEPDDSLADEADELLEGQGGEPGRPGDAGNEPGNEAGLEKLQFPLNVVETEDDMRTAKLQDFLLQKLEKVYLPIEGRDEAYMSDLIERMRKERSGESNKNNPGHPEFGAATKEMFAAYKQNLETRNLKAVMTELSTMDLGSPSLSPERLRSENNAGRMIPETPSAFLARMRRGDTEFKLQTAENGKMVDVDTNKLPTDDVLQRIDSVENFMSWANDKLILDRKLRYHENLLEQRIKDEGWPKQWLDNPMKETNRAGWCMAVMERITDSTGMARSIESLYAMRTKQGMANYGDDALKSLPSHVHVETEMRDGKEYVKRVTFDQPLDLDLKNPDFLERRGKEVDWQAKHGREIDKLVIKSDMAHADIKNWLFQGDIKMSGMQAIVDKKTNQVLGLHKKEILSDPAKLEQILADAGKKRSDVSVEDADLMRCRINAGQERGENGELKFITVDYGVQYGHTPPVNYHNLFMSPVGKPSRPSAEGEADGLQRFKPDEMVVGRDSHGEDIPMPAKDLALYAQHEDLKRALDLAVALAMDGSLAVAGLGAAIQGVRLISAASGAMSMIKAGQAGMAVAHGMTSKEVAEVGYRMFRHGLKDFALGASSLINNDKVQEYRGYYFLGHAASGLPGISRVTNAVSGRFGGARDAETLKSLKDAVLADGKTLKEVRALGLSEGSLYSAAKPFVERGFKYSNYAFAGILSHELYEQSKLINNIGTADGFAIAKDRMRGVDTQAKKLTPEEERVRQDEVHRTASRILDDYSRGTTGGDAAEVKSIVDRTKQLLEPPPAGLKGDELTACNAKRKAEIEQFQKDLRAGYLQFDGKRIADIERQRAEKVPSNAGDVARLKDDPVHVQGVQLESDKLAAAVETYRAKEEEFKKLGEPKDEAERNSRRDALATLKFQRDFAQDRYDTAVADQAVAIRGLETTDPKLDLKDAKLEQGTPEQKFAARQEAQKAAALAYMLLYSADGKELPADGVLAKNSTKIPPWKVVKTWQESAGDSSVTRTEVIETKERDANQALTVSDLTEILNADLGSDAPAMKRITTAEALDRLGVIPPEMHASVLKRIAEDKSADPVDRSRAIADLGAVIVQLELDEARRMASGMPMGAQLASSGDRFGNTSRDLKGVLAKIASDSSDSKLDVRAMATYMSYALDKRSSKWDDSDRDFFEKTVLQNPPTMTYDKLLGYLKPLAGMLHGDNKPASLEERDLAGWERRSRALVALEKLCNPKDGFPPGGGFSYKEINERLAQCAHPLRPATTAFVMNAMLENVRHDGAPRTRLQQLSLENPRAAMDLRRNALDLLKTPFGGDIKNDPNVRAELAARIQLMEQLPEFLKARDIPDSFKGELQAMRQEAGRVLKATLSAADEMEVRIMRAAYREISSSANPNKDEVARAKERLDLAERDMSLAKGCDLNPDSPQTIELFNRMRAAQNNPQEYERLREEWINSWGNSLYGTPRKDASGKNLPDMSVLNAIAYDDAELRKAAIRALGEFGAGDEDSRRILKERATAPDSDAIRDCRRESVADVRLAALNALQNSMAPLSFSRLCNELVEKEPSPGVATRMRMHTWYSDIALDPQSIGYQDLVQRATDFIKPYTNLDEIKSRYQREEGKQYWLSGNQLGKDLAAAADQYNWLTAGVTNVFSDTRVNSVEKQALLDTYNAYRNRIKTDIIDKFKDGNAAERKFAREMCFGLLAAPPEGFNDNKTQKDAQDKNAYSNQRLYASQKILHDIQMQAAKALSEACKAGNPERDQTAAYVIQSLKMTTDYEIKRELLKGLVHLSQNKVGGPTDKTEAETLAFDPGVGSKFVLDAINDSIADSAANSQKARFQLECADYLRDVMTSDIMRKTNVYAELEGKANHPNCPAPLRHALLDIVADRRDRVLPVWGACRVDGVNASIDDRMHLLREASADVKPDAQTAASINGSEAEARVPSAVYKIIAAVKDSEIKAGDPRIESLQTLASGAVKPGEKPTDERVRLAAAFALYKGADSYEVGSKSLDTIIDVAVNGHRPGSRRDAMEIIARMKGDYLRQAEQLLTAAKVRTEDAGGQPYPKKDVDMAEAARLGMLGKVQLAQNKNMEAEASLRSAYNLYLGKPVDSALLTGTDYSEQDWRKLGDYKRDARFREVADTVESLQMLRPDAHLGFSGYERYQAFGMGHPETIEANFRTGTRQKQRALEKEQKEGVSAFTDLFYARDQFVHAYNGAVSGFYPSPLSVRLDSLDEIGDISLRLAPKEHPLAIGIGHVPRSYNDAAYDLERAQRAYNNSLELKEKYKVPAGDLAQAHFNLARVAEAKAKLLPGHGESGMAVARQEIEKALQIARGAKDNLVLSEQLRNAAEFYKRAGDAQKSAQYAKEAMDIIEKRAGKGSLEGKSAEQIEETVASYKSSLGADNPLVARLLTDASRRYVQLGKLDMAEKHADAALAIYKAKPPESSDLVIDALNARHNAVFRHKDRDKNASCVDSLTWLRGLQEAKAEGGNSQDLQRTRTSLSVCLAARAAVSAEAGDLVSARRDFDLLLNNEKVSPGQSLSADAKERLAGIAKHLENQGNLLQHRNKYNEAGEVYAFALSCQLQANDGKLPEQVQKRYQDLVRNYEGFVATQLNALKSDASKAQDCSKAIETWVQLSKQLNNGNVSDEMLGKLSTVAGNYRAHIRTAAPPDADYDAVKMRGAESSYRSLLATDREILQALKARRDNQSQDVSRQIDAHLDELKTVNSALSEHYQKEKQFEKAEAITERSLGAARDVSADGWETADLLSQKLKVLAAQGKRDLALGEIEKHMEMQTAAIAGGEGKAGISDVLRYAAQLEVQQQMPGFAADSAARAIAALNRGIQTLPKEKQIEASAALNAQVLDALSEGGDTLNRFINDAEAFGKLPDAVKESYRDAHKRLSELRSQMHTAAEGPLKMSVEQWRARLTNKSEEMSPKHFRDLIDNYSKTGRHAEGAQFVRDHIKAVMEKGTPAQAAEALDIHMRALGFSDASPEQIADITAGLCKDVIDMIAEMPEASRQQLYATVGAQAASSMQFNASALSASSGGFNSSAANHDPVKREQAAKKLNAAFVNIAETLTPHMQRDIEKFEKSASTGEQRCEPLHALLEMNMAQGKQQEVLKIASNHFNALLSNGKAEAAARFVEDIGSSFGLDDSGLSGKFLVSAKDILDKQLSAVPPAQKDELLAKVSPVLSGRLKLESELVRANDAAVSEQLMAQAKAVSLQAKDAMKARLSSAIAAKDESAIIDAFSKLSSSYITLGAGPELKQSTESFARAMNEIGKTDRAMLHLQNAFDMALRSGENSKDVGAAALAGLQLVEEQIAKKENKEERGRLLRDLSYTYDRLNHYITDQDLAKTLSEKAKKLQEQSESILSPAGSR